MHCRVFVRRELVRKQIFTVIGMLFLCLGFAQAQEQPEIFPQLGHSSSVTAIAFSPDGRLLASGDAIDHKIVLWDVASGRQVRSLEGHTLSITTVAFSPDSRL